MIGITKSRRIAVWRGGISAQLKITEESLKATAEDSFHLN